MAINEVSKRVKDACGEFDGARDVIRRCRLEGHDGWQKWSQLSNAIQSLHLIRRSLPQLTGQFGDIPIDSEIESIAIQQFCKLHGVSEDFFARLDTLLANAEHSPDAQMTVGSRSILDQVKITANDRDDELVRTALKKLDAIQPKIEGLMRLPRE
jgi:hypothetical protein